MAVFKELPDLCIFDLDGTLADSLQDIAEALNECLALLGLPVYPVDSYRYMVGEGVPTLCQRAIGASHPQLVPRLIDLARARYRAKPLHHTRPYAGVPELVDRLAAAGVRLGVLSNKPHEMTRQMVQTFWPNGTFGSVYGYIQEQHRKPDPTYALRIVGEQSATPARSWIIGDTPTDVATARNAGIGCIAVTWGFRTRADLQAGGAELIVDRPQDIF